MQKNKYTGNKSVLINYNINTENCMPQNSTKMPQKQMYLLESYHDFKCRQISSDPERHFKNIFNKRAVSWLSLLWL